MNEIQLALKNAVGDIRITYGYRWLVWSDAYSEWVVMERKPYQKKTTCVLGTTNEQEAVDALLAG